MTDRSDSALTTLINIFTSPSAAYRSLESHRNWVWLPLVLMLLAAEGLWLLYFSVVDFAWYREFILSASGNEMTPEQLEQAKQFITKPTILISTLVTVPLALAFIYLLYALYLHIIAKTTGDERHGFGDWFNLTVWSYLPGLISVAAGFVVILSADNNQIEQSAVTPLVLNNLLFQYPPGHPWAGFWSAIDLSVFWSVGLLGLGLSQWSGRPFAQALLIAAAPHVLIFGIWALVLLL